MWKFVLDRLKEPSSWAGIAAAASQVATAVQSRDPAAIATVVLGAIAVLRPESTVK
jgi:DNA primase